MPQTLKLICKTSPPKIPLHSLAYSTSYASFAMKILLQNQNLLQGSISTLLIATLVDQFLM